MTQDEKTGFVNTVYFENIIKRTLQYLNSGYPVHFIGPSGVGKTSLALYIAKQMNRPVTVIRGHHELSNRDLLGHHSGVSKKEVVDNYIRSVYKKEQEIRPIWIQGKLVEAVKNGHVVIYDEFSRSRPETNNIFLSLLEEKILPLYGSGKGQFMKCHPEFRVIFTSNPNEYAGTFQTQDAIMDRFITIRLDFCDKETEMAILQKKTGVTTEEAEAIVKLMSNLRSYGKGFCPSLRASLMLATIAKHANIPINSQDKNYQTLCFDVLSNSVKQIFPDLSHNHVNEFILQEMEKKEVDQ